MQQMQEHVERFEAHGGVRPYRDRGPQRCARSAQGAPPATAAMPSSSPPAPPPSIWACPARRRCSARASAPAPPVTAFSTATRRWRSSAAAIPPSRRRCTWPISLPRSPWSTGATPCARRRSCRIGCSRGKKRARSKSCGTTRWRKSWATTAASPVCACAAPATAATREVDLAGVFIAIGHKPNTDIFAGQLQMKDGYLTHPQRHRRQRHCDQRTGRIRRRRRGGSHLSPGGYLRRVWLHGGAGCGEIPRRALSAAAMRRTSPRLRSSVDRLSACSRALDYPNGLLAAGGGPFARSDCSPPIAAAFFPGTRRRNRSCGGPPIRARCCFPTTCIFPRCLRKRLRRRCFHIWA